MEIKSNDKRVLKDAKYLLVFGIPFSFVVAVLDYALGLSEMIF